jgi:hypothetical protein
MIFVQNRIKFFQSLLLISIVLYGAFLRFFRVDANQIFGDEIHTLQCAAEKSFSWIFTHYAVHDTCIPLTLYNKFFLETIGVNEWIFRLPALACGTVLLIAVSYMMFKKFDFIETALAAGILAVSPYFVYMSREARPYIINTLLIWIAFSLAMKWRLKQNLHELIGVSVCCAIAIFFNPIVTPAVISIGLYLLFLLIIEKAPGNQWIQFAVSGAVFIAIMMSLMMPSFMSLLAGISQKGGQGAAGFETIKSGLDLLHGLPVKATGWVWVVIFISGLISLFKRFTAETLLVCAALALQMAFLFTLQPRKMEVPWVWVRYVAHFLPWLVICYVVGIKSIISILMPNKRKSFLLTILFIPLIVFWAGWHIEKRNYGIFKGSSYNVHPMILMIDKQRDGLKTWSPVVESYEKVQNIIDDGRVIESPMLFTIPLYQFYRVFHGKEIQTAGMGTGYAQNIFSSHDGFKFRTVFRFSKDPLPSPDKKKFLIVHKQIGEEIVLAYNHFCKDDIASKQLLAAGDLFSPQAINHMLGNSGFLDPESLNIAGEKVFEDYWLIIYEIS